MKKPGNKAKRQVVEAGMIALTLACLLWTASPLAAQDAQAAATRPVGTVKTIVGNTVTLTTDAKTDIFVQVPPGIRMVRTAPGQKDLTGATPITLSDLQVGDRMLARGTASPDGKTVVATSVIVMAKADVAQKQEKDVEDWNRRGVGGLVKEVDATAGTITLTTGGAPAAHPVTVRVTKDTIIRRYAPDSIKFDDAVKATLAQISPGDQLRARGNHSADGSELQAEEIVAGTFHNVAGLISGIDPANNTITFNDLATKKPVTVRITPDSTLHKLPAQIAQFMAVRLRGTPGNGNGNGEGQNGGQRSFTPPAGGQPQGAPNGGPPNGGGPRGGGRGGDIQQMLSRMPAVTLAELQKGDAVMVVTTQGSATAPMVAITLLTGVEPILTAAPTGNRAAMLLTPWNLGGGGGGEGE